MRHLASRPVACAAALAIAVVAAYAFSLRGEFLWDDDLHITANPTIVGPLGLKEIWTTARANYFPLVLTNFWIQHALWGLEPFGYRLVTLLFHAGAAVLLWRVLLQMRVPGAWLGAALWALHPVQVESVAWICELKNTQSAVFFLAAVWSYLRWLEGQSSRMESGSEGAASSAPYFKDGGDEAPPSDPLRSRNVGRYLPRGSHSYALALLCAVLAILSKPSTVMLPVALALGAWWLRRRFGWRDLLPLAPFFALSALAAVWTIWEQKHHSGAIGDAWNQTLAERCVIAGRVVWFYLGKLAWPEPLIFIYPRWPITADSILAFVPLAAVVGALGALWRFRGRGPAVAGGFLAAAYFVALLFPVLGFFNVYFFRYSYVGDHFQYLAGMGPLALAGAVLARVFHRHDEAESHPVGWSPDAPVADGERNATEASRSQKGPVRAMMLRPFAAVLSGVVLLVLGVLTGREAREYASNEALWHATLARNPQAIMAWLNLGDTLTKKGRLEEAIVTFTHVTRMRPEEADAFNDLGGALLLAGRPAEAFLALERAVALAPRRPEMHNNLGNAQRALGRLAEATGSFRRALELDPEYAEAHNNLGAELAESGQTREAIGHFRAALRVAPKNTSALNNLGHALRGLGRLDEAMASYRHALQIKPDSADALAGLGYAFVLGGRDTEGLPLLQRAMQANPNHAGIRGQLGRALAAAGRPDEAFSHFARAVELAPHSAEAHNNFGTALAQQGRGAAAIAEFEQAVRLAPLFAGARSNLGTALLAASRWSSAAAQFAEAVRLQPDDADGHARLAVARVNAGQLADAVAPFETALRLNPNSAEVHDNFAQALRALGRNREALEHFERAAELRRPRR